MNPVVKEVFAQEAQKHVESPSTERGEGERVAHAEVLGERKSYLCTSMKENEKGRRKGKGKGEVEGNEKRKEDTIPIGKMNIE